MVRKGIHRMRMTCEELDELLEIHGWNRVDLASELRMTPGGIDKWYRTGGPPDGPVSILLREWLVRSRQGLPLYTDEPQPATAAG